MNHSPSFSGHVWGWAIRTFPEILQTPSYKRMFKIDTPCFTTEENLVFGEIYVYLLLEKYSLTDLGGFKRMTITTSTGEGVGRKSDVETHSLQFLEIMFSNLGSLFLLSFVVKCRLPLMKSPGGLELAP